MTTNTNLHDQQRQDPPGISPLRHRVSLTLITALAAVAGSFRIGVKGLSLDEAVGVVRLSAGPFPDLIRRLQDEEITLALYHIFLYGWKQFAVSEAGLRSLSLVFFVLSVPPTYALGRRLLGQTPALLGSFFLAIHGFAIEWAQEVRGYSLLMCLSVLCFLTFLNLIEGKRMAGLWFSACWALLLLTHLFAWILLTGLLVSLLLYLPTRRRWLPELARSGPLIVLASAYVAWSVLRNVAGGAGLGWVPPLSLARIKGLLVQLSGGEVLSGVIIVPILATALTYLLVRGIRRGTWEPGVVTLLLWAAMPIIATLLLSVMVHPMLVSRYLIGLVPLVALILAHVVLVPRERWIQFALAALVIVALSYGALGWYTAGARGDYRTAAQIVATQASPDDVVAIIPDYLHWPFGYYYSQEDNADGPAIVELPEGPTALTDALALYREPDQAGLWVVIRRGDLEQQAGDLSVEGGEVQQQYELDGLMLFYYPGRQQP